MATVIPFANGKNGFCQVNSNCRSIHLDFPFLHFRLTVRNSILAHRCRLAYATSGMWEVPFIVIQLLSRKSTADSICLSQPGASILTFASDSKGPGHSI